MSKKLHTILDTILTKKQSWKTDLLNNWYSILGEINTKVHLEKIYDDTLVLAVQDACWLQELYLLSPMLLKTINQNLDQPRIKSLRFKQASRKRKKAQTTKHTTTHTAYKEIVYSAQEQHALQRVEDQQLHDALRDYLTRCYREKEREEQYNHALNHSAKRKPK